MPRSPLGAPGAAGILRRGARPGSAHAGPATFVPAPTGTPLTSLRVGETLSVQAVATDSGEPAPVSGSTWSIVGESGVFDLILPDPVNAPGLATVRGLRPGTATLRHAAVAQFGAPLQTDATVTVLDAARIDLAPVSLVFAAGGLTLPPLRLTGRPFDVREAAGQPAYPVNGIAWSSDGGRVTFMPYSPTVGPPPSEEAGTPTLTGTLDVWVLAAQAGADIVRVVATNSIGAQIAGQAAVTVRAATTLSIVVGLSTSRAPGQGTDRVQ